MDLGTSINKVLVFIFGFLFGVLTASFIFTSPILSLLIFSIGLLILVAEKIQNKTVGKEVLLLALIVVSFSLGTLRYSIKDFYEPIEPTTTGVVISEPEQKENSTNFVMFSDNGEKVLVRTDLYSSVRYGDKIEINGKIERPGIIDDGSGRPFDYGKFLSKDDVYFTSSFTEVNIVSSGHGNFIKSALFKIKNGFVSKIREIFAEPESSLLAGLIVAGKAAMPREVLEEFKRAGIIHIVVLSGFNITIIADFMRRSFEKAFLWTRFGARPRVAAGASIFGILLFVIMTGAEATVVRAAIMVLVVIVAKMFGQSYSAPRALIAAAFLMVMQNPKILVFDPSFQLSFLATCGLIYITPIVERFLVRIHMKEFWGLRTILATTLATQCTVLPYLIYSMGAVSLVSLPANILVLLIIPYTMLAGFIATLLAFIHPFIALPVSYVSHLMLSWILGVSNYLGNISFASIPVPPFPFGVVVVLYVLIIVFVRRFQNSVPHSSNSS